MKLKSILSYPILLSCFIVFGCNSLAIPTSKFASTSFTAREVISQTLPLEEKWRVESGRIDASFSSHAWQWTELGLIYTNTDRQLVLLSDQNGQPLWQTQYDKFSRRVDSLVANQEKIYLVSDWRIKAFSLADGQFLWQTEKQTAHRGYYLYLKDGVLLEYERPVSDKNIIYKFDPENGLRLETEILPANNPPVMVLIGDIYLGKANGKLWAVSRSTHEVLWYIPSGLGHIRTPPLIINNELLVIADEANLVVLTLDTGEILWQEQNYALSNPIVLENVLYVITEDGSIVGHNLVSGEELGTLQMSPPNTDPSRYTYALAANLEKGLVYTYYGDCEEIIAFGK